MREDLLANALAALQHDGTEGFDRCCEESPEHADWLRRQREFLTGLGLLDNETMLHGLPRRLGDFELLHRIGGGGMGVVFAARQVSLDREVAVKIVRPELIAFPQARARFQREVDAVARVQHPAIVRIHAAGEAHDVPFLAMERLHGTTLAAVLERLSTQRLRSRTGADLGPRYAEDWPHACARLVLEIAEGMEHAHARGVLHRDLKPSNILMTETGAPVIIDFGLAIADGDLRITRSQSAIGSLPYSAPERLAGADDDADERADVYSLGATLYELLTGGAPFVGATFERLRAAVLLGEFTPVRRLNPQVSRDLACVCESALAPARRRYRSMARFAADLRAVLARRPIAARPMGAVGRTARWLARRPTAVALTALALVLAGGVPTALLARERARSNERTPLLATATADNLMADADEMWPTGSALLEGRGSYDAWLEQARDLLPQRLRLERLRDDLRRRGTHRGASEPLVGHRERRLRRELTESRDSDAWMERSMVYGKEARQLPLHIRMQSIEWQLDEELAYEFTDVEDELRHAAVVRALARIDDVAASVPAMERRRDQARSIAAREADAAASWIEVRAALADVAKNPAFAGTGLRPQAGLIPLGPDPESGLQEFAHLPSGEAARRDPATGRLRLDENTGVVLVLLPGGTFRMGAAIDDPIHADPAAEATEAPCRDTALAPFFVAKFELTQGQWQRITGLNPSIDPPGSGADENPRPTTPLHPVEDIRWDEARAALHRLGLELPTEAQWEYAARAGGHRPFGAASTDADLPGVANCRRQDPRDPWRHHAPVGTFAANAFGLHDTLGNVAEWCLDGCESYTVPPLPGDGRRPCRPDCPRIIRGGHYDSASPRVSERPALPPGSALMQVGVRPVRSVD